MSIHVFFGCIRSALLGSLLVLGVAWLRGQARPPGEWKHMQRLQIDTVGLIRVPVPLATLDGARAGLEDLRIYDGSGKEVPYLLERPAPEKSVLLFPADFASSLGPGSTVVVFSNPGNHPVDKVIIETPAGEFLKSSRLEASRDGSRWQTLADAVPLYRQPDGRSGLEIQFPAGNWNRFRLTLEDRREPAIPITGARLRTAPPANPALLPLGLRISERTEVDGATHLRILADGANVVLGRLEMETPESLFSRRVDLYARRLVDGEIHEVLIASGQVVRTAADSPVAQMRMDAPDAVLLPAKEFIVCIKNADSPPLQIRAVKAWRYPVYLIWESKAPGTASLLSGNPACAAPSYDLAAMRGKLNPHPAEPSAVSALEANPGYQPAGLAMDFPETAGAIDLSGWTYRKRVKPGPAGMQQLELDPEILARAAVSLRDLRLVRSGKQVPYLVERTLQRRYITPEVEPGTGGQDPRQSRWSLRLPRKNLPIDALSFNTDAVLFRRQVRLYDEAPESRPRGWRMLAQTQWFRRPSAAKEKLELSLPRAPETERLTLEVENGDNPPLELRDFKVSYRVTRLVFRCSGAGETFLYYGNRKSPAPRYDIEFLAAEWLPMERNTATVEPEEVLSGSLFRGEAETSPWPGWIYWGALAMVVVVLFAVIRHLLPGPPGNTT